MKLSNVIVHYSRHWKLGTLWELEASQQMVMADVKATRPDQEEMEARKPR
jgi:hypothetical protein